VEIAAAGPTWEKSNRPEVDWFCWLVPVAVLISRVLTTATPYYSDGWRHLRAIHDGTYIIQPPGYWLFNRLAGLFPNGELGLSVINWICSPLGVAVFYACAQRVLPNRRIARWATAVYACIFYAWFSGSVHSTYATQLLFPVLTYYCLLRARQESQSKYLYLAAVAVAIGAGMRPSDGVFMAPLFFWRLFFWPSRRQAILAVGVAAAFCCVWLVPTMVAYANVQNTATAPLIGNGHASDTVTKVSVLSKGLTRGALASVTRFVVALGFALWPILLAGLFGREPIWDRRKLDLWIWVLPGLLFFTFVYFGEAGYLNCCTAGIVLLGFLHMKRLSPKVQAATAALCIAFNVGFFIFYTPTTSRSLAVNVVNMYSGRYTLFNLRYGIDVMLSQVSKDPTLVQPASRLPGGRWSYIWHVHPIPWEQSK
jgi:4-amino-4-deoxy-L-arabinose transferase-like glycosyltransferase